MTTIKSYTDIEQSKKLAGILPLESADMHYVLIDTDEDKYDAGLGKYIGILPHYPAWSLAALLGVLPAECECMALEHINYGNNHKEYFMHYVGGENTDDYDNPVDACVSMVEKLHELNLL